MKTVDKVVDNHFSAMQRLIASARITAQLEILIKLDERLHFKGQYEFARAKVDELLMELKEELDDLNN